MLGLIGWVGWACLVGVVVTTYAVAMEQWLKTRRRAKQLGVQTEDLAPPHPPDPRGPPDG